MNKKIRTIESTAIPLPQQNIDTDQIIPARFLKRTETGGWGEYLFRDWKYENGQAGKPNRSFILNKPAYKGKILVAGHNFGCGSSREHAAWAIKQYGIDAVVSSGFADIFHTNALNNFLLPVTVSERFLDILFDEMDSKPDVEFTINLYKQTISIGSSGIYEHFEISAYKKHCFLEGFDDIDFLINSLPEIQAYERRHNKVKTY